MEREDFKRILGEVLLDMGMNGTCDIARKWQGGSLVLKPANPEQQAKDIPIEVFFNKIIMARERLRVLEQNINSHPKLDAEDKLHLQQYITRVYGSLTTFNVLFSDKNDYFVGDSKKRREEDDDEAPAKRDDRFKGKSINEIEEMIGINHHKSR
jgi:hypothetical protein